MTQEDYFKLKAEYFRLNSCYYFGDYCNLHCFSEWLDQKLTIRMRYKSPHKIILGCLSATVVIVSMVLFFSVYQSAKDQLLDNRLQSGEREVREIGRLLELQLQSGLSKEVVIKNLQHSILNTDVGMEFICMYDTNGVELCHPNPALIGHQITINDSYLHKVGKQDSKAFLEVLQDGSLKSGIRDFTNDPNRGSEVVTIYPVGGTDWLVASHVNIDAMQAQLSILYNNLLVVFLIGVLLIIALSYFLIRRTYRRYEQLVSKQVEGLNEEVELLNTLNQQLLSTKQSEQIKITNTEKDSSSKKRIITYHKDEMIAISTDSIAYVFLNNGLSFLRTFSNENYAVNGSLDDIYKQLDAECFYRVNRQLIINISAIKTIYIYGKNQLKLLVDPVFDQDVLISKNKVAAFKKWLDR